MLTTLILGANAAVCQYHGDEGCHESLPFTGYDVLYVLIAGLILIGAYLMIRVVRKPQ